MKRLKFIVAEDSCLQNPQQNTFQCHGMWKIHRILAKATNKMDLREISEFMNIFQAIK